LKNLFLKTEFNCIEPNETIKEQAEDIITTTNQLFSTLEIYNWVINNITYLYVQDGEYGNVLETLEEKKGTCHSYTCLYASLLRSINIPTKYVTIYSLDNNIVSYHAENEIYSKNQDLWLPIDTTWGSTINDWYLSRKSSQLRLGELYPPAYDLYWLKSYNTSLSFVEDYGTYEVLSKEDIWDTYLLSIYELSKATDYSNIFYTKDKYKYYLFLQDIIDDYYNDQVISKDNLELINSNTKLIYKNIISNIEDKYFITKEEIDQDINKIKSFEYITHTLEVYPEEELFNFEKDLNLIKEAIELEDYNLVEKNILEIQQDYSDIKYIKSKLDLTLSNLEYYLEIYNEQIDVNTSKDLNIDNINIKEKIDLNQNVIKGSVNTSTTWIIIIMSIFWIWMLIDCISNKNIKEKALWIILIILTYILFWIGAILYLFIKYIPNIKNKRQEKKKIKI
jgi:hypothetical protein